MDQHTDGKQPELNRLNYTELKDYVREKGYNITLTQSADQIRKEIKAIEAGPTPDIADEEAIEGLPFEVSGKPPKHPKLKEWLLSFANRYGITRFEYAPKFSAFKLYRKELKTSGEKGKTEWKPDPDGQERHFEWVSLHELAVTFGELHYKGAPKAQAKYQPLNKRLIQIKQYI